MVITLLQIHKRDSLKFKFIQDKFAWNKLNKSFAIADGTTQSFNSENWAKLLTASFVENPLFEPSQLIQVFSELTNTFDDSGFQYSENPAKASLEKGRKLKGGTSTFLGIQFTGPTTVKVIACGDSNLFVLNGKSISNMVPFTSKESLDGNNHFVNTEALKKKEVDIGFFQSSEIEIQKHEKILLATDALSRLILEDNNVVNELNEVSNFEQLHSLCLKYWDTNKLQEDDITAVIIEHSDIEKYTEIVPPLNFEYPKIEVPEFTLSPVLNKNKSKFSDMQMDEIQNQFNGVAKDFHYVKQRLRINNLLIVLAIFLLSVNLIFMFINRPKKSPQKVLDRIEKIVPHKKEKKQAETDKKTKVLTDEDNSKVIKK